MNTVYIPESKWEHNAEDEHYVFANGWPRQRLLLHEIITSDPKVFLFAYNSSAQWKFSYVFQVLQKASLEIME